jgi:hypothetical protein
VDRRGFLAFVPVAALAARLAPQLLVEAEPIALPVVAPAIASTSGFSLADLERDMLTVYTRDKVIQPYQRLHNVRVGKKGSLEFSLRKGRA